MKKEMAKKEIRQNLKEAQEQAKKAWDKASAKAMKNAKATMLEVAKDVQPEVGRIKSKLSKAMGTLKKSLA